MKLSKRGEYALRALDVLTTYYSKEGVHIKEISGQAHVPRKFLEQILVELKNGGVLQSTLGKKGGYSLRKSPGMITVGEVLRIIDGPLAPLDCASRTRPAECPDCPYPREDCWLRGIMRDVRDAIAGVLDTLTLIDVRARARLKKGRKSSC